MSHQPHPEFTGFNHEKTRGKEEWLTPKWILDPLGEFDLDPCASKVRPWSTAKLHYTIFDNGLMKEWNGRIWLNPPYGNETNKWLRRMAAHKSGICLIFARTETSMFFESIWPVAHSILFMRGRVCFCDIAGKTSQSAGAPSCLISYSSFDTEILERSGLKGQLVYLRERTPR